MGLQKGMTFTNQNQSQASSLYLRPLRDLPYLKALVQQNILPDRSVDSMAVMILRVRILSLCIDLASSIDQWVDYINQSVSPISQAISQQVFGQEATDMKNFSIALNQLKKAIQPFEKHLKLRNFLVGYSLTLADVTLVVNLITPLQTVLDAGFRKDSIPNLSRYCQLILDSRAFL